MSLQATANLLQQQGRGNDKMLVHMTPREVAGLEAIARAKGGSLTINPQTGLPEAGFLDDILPIAASAALMYFGGPLGASIGQSMGLSGALAQGVGMGLLTGGATTLLTGDINKGLKTGLTSGILSGGMAAMSGPSTIDIPTSNVDTSTVALQAASTPTSPNAFAYDSTGAMVPANYPASVTGATNLPAAPTAMVGPPASAKPFTGNQKLAMGLGGAGLLSVLGSQNQGGVSAPTDKGTIRPYEYSTAMRTPQAGQSQYFQPIQYDIAGRPSQPIDTSERNYFTQGYKALPTYEAADGGQVPQLDNMPNGGLAAIQGMREGYAPMTTMSGDIPQFADGGMPTNKMLEQMQQMKFERDMPDNLRDFVRAKRMGLMEGTMFGDEQARMMGQKPQEFMFAPGISQDGRNINALATMNKDLTDDTELKLMAMGYKTPEKSGIAKYGAGINRKLGKDSDLSAFFEQSPGGRDKSFGAKYSKRFNMGGMAEGDLGGYSDGGRMLKGPGDGVSDSIPATINDKQPARLADGEFVIPARIVSELGNGSTDAGAKRLYAMMDRIQADRKKTVGKGKVAVDSKAKKHLPA
jgi:hypothetical protein